MELLQLKYFKTVAEMGKIYFLHNLKVNEGCRIMGESALGGYGYGAAAAEVF